MTGPDERPDIVQVKRLKTPGALRDRARELGIDLPADDVVEVGGHSRSR